MGPELRIVWIAMLVLSVGSPTPAAETHDIRIAVVANPKAPAIALDRTSLRDIFLKRIVIDGAGSALVPLNLPPDDPLRAAFASVLIGKTPDALQRYWNERYFQGVSPPYVVRSQEAMLRFIAETPGALGYVASCQVDDRVRVVAELTVPSNLVARVAAQCPRRSSP